MSLKIKLPKKRIKSGITLILDTDSVVYACGFAGESKDEELGVTVHEPLSHVLHSVKNFINSIIEDTNAEFSELYLTGDNNFRDEIATIQPYKGHRVDFVKPLLYQEIRDYMVNKLGAIVVDGMEADDQCIIRGLQLQKEGKEFVIATRDKDLLQIPAKFYRY